MKSLTHKQQAHITDVLQRLREHFPDRWPGNAAGREHRLIEFAYYEGCGHRPGWECCRDLLAEATPFAVGQELVANHGFRWVMLGSGRARRFGVAHPALGQPLDLAALEDGSWCEEEFDQPAAPGRKTLESLPTIIERIRGLQYAEPIYGRESQ